MISKMRNDKEDLVERLGVFMEQKEQLAPVAARILSYIILTGKAGTTFDDLVRDLCASKSTISTHLNHLADLKRILYFTKTGDRKKYYTINEDSIIQSIDAMTESWILQKELHLEIREYKEKTNQLKNDYTSKFNLDFHDTYIEFLDEVTKAVSTLKSRILEKNTKL
ncbi:transcriptional regulator [Gelidibacter japonicus]|uniref:GbsR/MarR family transcriptional regulator n=1 Tax=Gelidibacter japonicus TaxID=1962232 RepID=UPI0020226399|nr:transcriptional regulator [Gelidibacter japonicus]MCL8008582.1 transcriptional regulator [Gelidibacter japonicus]